MSATVKTGKLKFNINHTTNAESTAMAHPKFFAPSRFIGQTFSQGVI